MNSLLLGLALSSSPSIAAQPPLPPVLPPGTPLTGQYRPGYSNPYRPVTNPYQPGYPRRPAYYPPTAPPPFAPASRRPGSRPPAGTTSR